MVTEDYVSFEIASLLNEKGFDEEVLAVYIYDALVVKGESKIVNTANVPIIPAPTLQMACKWLREVHKLYINIWADPKDAENDDFSIIFRAQVYNGYSNYGTYEFSTYEEAVEASLKHALENLL